MAKVNEPAHDYKNKISEKVLDITKLIIGRGDVVLEIVEPNTSGIILPDSMDKSGFVYYKVLKTGMEDYLKVNPDPEYKMEGKTQAGNIAISVKVGEARLLTNKGKKYIVVHESAIETQVTPDNFDISNQGTR